jgi:hypothetical protein
VHESLDPAAMPLTDWLAEHGGADSAQVEAELELGARRRVAVVDELLDAGYGRAELMDLVVRLTGFDESAARALVAARTLPLPDAPEPRGTSKRDERVARNEHMFRRVNERLAAEFAPSADVLELLCECADRDCLKLLRIDMPEWEWLRVQPRRFAVLPGHEAPAVEDVVERRDGYVLVQKHTDAHEQLGSPGTRP